MNKLDEFIKDNVGDISIVEIEDMPIDSAVKVLDKDFKIYQALEKAINAKNKLADINLKKVYGYCILGILGFWILLVAFICITYIFQDFPNISDAVLITILTTTTANILVLPTIVLKYLFPNKKG